jgi:hypothetical protein
MNSKRLYESSSTKASLMNVMTGDVFCISGDRHLVIGRAKSSVVAVEEPYVSDHQCYIQYRANRKGYRDVRDTSVPLSVTVFG